MLPGTAWSQRNVPVISESMDIQIKTTFSIAHLGFIKRRAMPIIVFSRTISHGPSEGNRDAIDKRDNDAHS